MTCVQIRSNWLMRPPVYSTRDSDSLHTFVCICTIKIMAKRQVHFSKVVSDTCVACCHLLRKIALKSMCSLSILFLLTATWIRRLNLMQLHEHHAAKQWQKMLSDINFARALIAVSLGRWDLCMPGHMACVYLGYNKLKFILVKD